MKNQMTVGQLEDAPCACDECRAGMRGELEGREWGMGHFACHNVPEKLLKLEEAGEIFARYNNGRWEWVLATRYHTHR